MYEKGAYEIGRLQLMLLNVLLDFIQASGSH